jgi:hypothetical protein
MLKLDSKCCSASQASLIQREENGKIFRIINGTKRKIVACKVDGCLIDDGSIKCDFLFIIDETSCEEIALVELKGTAHVHALRQIIITAERLDLKKKKCKKSCFIVSSPSPKTATVYQAELKKLQSRFNAAGLELPIKKNNLVEIRV